MRIAGYQLRSKGNKTLRHSVLKASLIRHPYWGTILWSRFGTLAKTRSERSEATFSALLSRLITHAITLPCASAEWNVVVLIDFLMRLGFKQMPIQQINITFAVLRKERLQRDDFAPFPFLLLSVN